MKDVRTCRADTVTVREITVRTGVMATSCEVRMLVYLEYKYQIQSILTFWRWNYFLNFSTFCI